MHTYAIRETEPNMLTDTDTRETTNIKPFGEWISIEFQKEQVTPVFVLLLLSLLNQKLFNLYCKMDDCIFGGELTL